MMAATSAYGTLARIRGAGPSSTHTAMKPLATATTWVGVTTQALRCAPTGRGARGMTNSCSSPISPSARRRSSSALPGTSAADAGRWGSRSKLRSRVSSVSASVAGSSHDSGRSPAETIVASTTRTGAGSANGSGLLFT